MPRDRRRRWGNAVLALLAAGIVAGWAVALITPAGIPNAVARLGDSTSVLLHGDVAPPPVATPRAGHAEAAGAASPADGTAQAGIVAAEDARLDRLVSGRPATVPYVLSTGGQAMPTLVLTPRPRPYDLDDLRLLGSLVLQPDGSWMLIRSVFVAAGAELRVQAPGTVLRLASAPSGFASIVAAKGTITLGGNAQAPLTITSWDPATNAPDTDEADGRAYLRAAGARMDLSRVVVHGLGFWSGRTGGIAWTGNSHAAAVGGASDVDVVGDHYGMFTSRAQDIALSNTSLAGNDLDGLLVHHGTRNLTARGLTTEHNGGDGIAITRGAEQVTVSGASASDNVGDGVRIDGSPLAADATAGGASTVRGSRYTVSDSSLTGNGQAGLVAESADDVALTGNTVAHSPDGIVVRGLSARPLVGANTVDVTGFGIAVRGGVTRARVMDNQVRATIGMHVTDSTAAIDDNTITATRYGVSLVGRADDSSVTDNVFAGRGLAAVDTHRMTSAAVADVGANDVLDWQTERDNARIVWHYVRNHPALLVWLGIVALPLLARAVVRRRRQTAALPYANALAPRPWVYTAADHGASDRSRATRLTLVSAGKRP